MRPGTNTYRHEESSSFLITNIFAYLYRVQDASIYVVGCVADFADWVFHTTVPVSTTVVSDRYSMQA